MTKKGLGQVMAVAFLFTSGTLYLLVQAVTYSFIHYFIQNLSNAYCREYRVI